MFSNYLKTAWRNLWKNRTFSTINIGGLALGIAAFLLIMSYLAFEYSYDDYNANADRLYRIPMEIVEKGQVETKPQTFAFTYPAVAPALKHDFPEVAEAIRFRKQWGVVKYQNEKFLEDDFLFFVDPGVLKMFSFDFEKGSSQTTFSDLNDAIITTSTAKKYFGDADPIGKPLTYNKEDYIVKAVVKDLPENSHLDFHILLNYNKYVQLVKNFGGDAQNSWNWSDFYTYVLLKPGTNANTLQAQLPAFALRHMGENMQHDGFKITFNVQPLKDIHLHSKYDYEWTGNGNFTYLKYLGIAGFFILFIAWINYINLSTARALDRAKEVGVRKVIGAGKRQLIRQFLTESLLINFAAVLLGLAIYSLSLPYFCRLVGLQVASVSLPGTQFSLLLCAIFLSGALLAGAYPSFILSSYSPLEALKPAGTGTISRRNKDLLRRSLVIIQFFTAILLISGAIGFYKQLHYMSSADLGVNVSQTLTLNQPIGLDSTKTDLVSSFVNELASYPGVSSVTQSTSIPGSEIGGSSGFTTLHSTEDKRCRDYGIDNKFIDAYGLELLAGRNFTTDRSGKITNIILNETAVNVFGFGSPAKAIGQQIRDNSNLYTIIGVLKDFHQKSLQNDFDPIVFYPEYSYNMSNFSIKFNTTDLKGLMAFVKQKWTARFPDSPFSYNFLDDIFNAQYKSDQLFSTVLWLFTLLAIIVASLGLLGLSLYTVAKRSKEISIRKVLGATVFQITRLIVKDYLKLIVIAAIPAIPIAYYVLRNWLDDYAFHISIGLWFIIAPVAMIGTIAMTTVLYHSIRAALGNPVKNLKTE